MINLPHAVIAYILNFVTEERSLAYLLVDKNGSLLAWGGKLTEYGINHLCKGEQIGEQIYFLEGLLPLDDTSLFLPFIKSEAGICVDIHIFASAEGDWVLLLNSFIDEKHFAVMQQEVNNYSLLQEKSTKLSDQ